LTISVLEARRTGVRIDEVMNPKIVAHFPSRRTPKILFVSHTKFSYDDGTLKPFFPFQHFVLPTHNFHATVRFGFEFCLTAGWIDVFQKTIS
jgi:hypothetical protein